MEKEVLMIMDFDLVQGGIKRKRKYDIYIEMFKF